MAGDRLMNDDLEKEMKKIEIETVQKKRKNILKNLQGRQLQPHKTGVNRSLAETIDVNTPIQKRIYLQEHNKMSDRFVPRLNNYAEL
jgi:hypothetical protein